MGVTGPQTIFVDGYNVIRTTPELARAERLGLAHGREALLARLVARYRHTPHRVVVVFDGDGPTESTQQLKGLSRGQVIYTRRGETADAAIARLAAQCANEADHISSQIVVVSDDYAVRADGALRGATPARASELAQRMREGPRLQAKQARHRQFLRQQWAAEADGEYIPPDRSKGNGHRAPRKRREAPDRRW